MGYGRAGAFQAAGSGFANFGRQLMELSAQRKAQEEADKEQALRQKQLDYSLGQSKDAAMERLGERQASENRWQAEQARSRESDEFNRSRTLAEMIAKGFPEARVEGSQLVPGTFDPLRTPDYVQREAERQANIKAGFTPTGANITPDRDPAPPRQDFILVGGRYFPNTPEGAGQAMEWQQQLGEAKDGPSIDDQILRALGGGEGTTSSAPRPGIRDRVAGWFGKGDATAQPSPTKPVAERMAELKAEGKSYEEAMAILQREGYR